MLTDETAPCVAQLLEPLILLRACVAPWLIILPSCSGGSGPSSLIILLLRAVLQ